MKKFDYKVQNLGHGGSLAAIMLDLGRLGSDGWELVNVVTVQNIVYAYMKRERR